MSRNLKRMKPMKRLTYLFLLLGGGLFAQTITPQVINSAGSHYVMSNGASLTDNVGEPFTAMLGPVDDAIITQGFLQPEVFTAMTPTVTLAKNDVTCADKDDGRISTALNVTLPSSYTVSYIWTPTTACPAQNCSTIDSLRAGTYSLKVVISYSTLGVGIKTMTASVTNSVQTVTDLNGPCKVKIFTGVTINGGNNGHLHIENISEFPNNRITIYNRWGAQLYDEKGYDNITKFWPTSDDLNKLLPSTYFYVLDLGDGSKPIKGWVELLKN